MERFRSPTLARIEYKKMYPNSRPSLKSFTNNYKKFLATSSVDDRPKPGRPSLDKVRIPIVQAATRRHPESSIRQLAQETNIPICQVQRILRKKLKLYPYRVINLPN